LVGSTEVIEMKIGKIRLQNFKRFDSYELDLTDPLTGQPRDLTVLVGENGSGKTTLLQAVALPLAVATRRIRSPEDFHWPGFLLERLNPLTTRIELDVEFYSDELETTAELSEELRRLGFFEGSNYQPPSKNARTTLFYKQGRVECSSPEEFFQFRGREYAKHLTHIRGFEPFKKVGGVFWYDQERQATSLTREDSEPTSMKALRDDLVRLWSFHVSVRHGEKRLRPGTLDLYDELERSYQNVFRPRRLAGIEPKPMLGSEGLEQDFWFMLDDGRRYYELDEMSSGERAVFPILFDFVKWSINCSVILIDEIELHLHPPLQQFLLQSLPKLGQDNQFIITTHSEEVLNVLPENVIHRLGS
jgi:ABC-type lipoprotein export system ATPase subunit